MYVSAYGERHGCVIFTDMGAVFIYCFSNLRGMIHVLLSSCISFLSVSLLMFSVWNSIQSSSCSRQAKSLHSDICSWCLETSCLKGGVECKQKKKEVVRERVQKRQGEGQRGVKEIGENLEKASLFSAALHDNPWVEPSGVRPLSHVLPYLAQ